MAEETPARVEPRFAPGHESEGRPAALIAWGLYILSLPSANLLVIVGLIVAYAGRGGSDGLSRAHIDAQIRLFWSVFWWTILLWIGFWACVVGVVMEPATGFVLVPLAIILLLALLFLTVWFTIKSIIGLINLLGDRAP
ncbi:MAG: hypothetical protein KKC29_08120 [Alphaproteobacteria bacterium]|jgi:uncharacterized membrane protein|nr:hypothetical protein [Alphaproteobacteria bacterium]MBU2041639.1 hypothetical protein [Alphaproteobacteria bacterium]MBU2126551.1 hypothetical protein [Alphaproteobacteria bacterium]MBU2208675.1 hypothetical protein [Alphaproteobacteria bacterium]MBU2291053.1 hypothetical protein [Alphaproteobacteria bacterium]